MGLFGNFNKIQRSKVNMEISNKIANDINVSITNLFKEKFGTFVDQSNTINISATNCNINRNKIVQKNFINISKISRQDSNTKAQIAQELNAQIKNENKAVIEPIVETAGDAALAVLSPLMPFRDIKIINEKEFKNQIVNEIRSSTNFQLINVADISEWTEVNIANKFDLVCKDSNFSDNTIFQIGQMEFFFENFNNFVTNFASQSSTIANVYNKIDLYYKEHTDIGDAVSQLKWILLALAGVILSIAVVAVVVLLIIGSVTSAPGKVLASLK